MKKDELKRKVEEVKQDADVQRALQQATPTERIMAPAAPAVATSSARHAIVPVGRGRRLHQFNSLSPAPVRVPSVAKTPPRVRRRYCLLYGAPADRRLLHWASQKCGLPVQLETRFAAGGVAVIAFFVLTIFFQNWYTAVVSFGLISLILGFALQTPITSFIGWIYILVREPYRVGDRIKIGTATGDVIDVSYLDTTLWEFGGDYLSTDHPSGRIIKFPNANVLDSLVYNYTWPLFPYIWNEIKFQIAYKAISIRGPDDEGVAEQEVGEEMMKQVEVFREILAKTPVNQLEVQERPVVLFRVGENTWLEAIVRYLVHPKEAGRVKSRLIKELLHRLNAEPDRVMFPRDSAR